MSSIPIWPPGSGTISIRVGGSIDPEDAYIAFRGKVAKPAGHAEKKGLSTFEELSSEDAKY